MEKGKISSLQMAFMLYPAIVATAILGVPSITAKYAKTDLWLSPIFAALIGYLTVYIAYKLHQLYPKQTVIQFSEKIIGRIPGKIFGFLLLFFYIQNTGLLVRGYAEFVVGSFLVRTPISVIMVSMVLLCAFIVRGGIEVLGRAAQLFVPVFIFPIFILIILLIPDLEFKNIFPVLADGIMPPIKGSIVPGGWFSEFFLMIFLLPFLVDMKKGMKSGMMSVFAVMMTLIVVNLTVLFVLGSTTSTKLYPLMNVSRYISIADFFEHVESAVMAVWIVGAFVKISVFYYACALGTAQWLNLSDYRPVVWPVGIFIVIFSLWSLPSSVDVSRNDINVFPLQGILMQTIIPLLLLLIAVVRKRNRKGTETSRMD
ncbi:endospore germination permease [Peribacillus frigoritolerans]|uniref:GerAB/ArcD/ProY family transporter n=1 Tax=Peribacillus frigoritolerans TaxID=450367 RepID=UPI002E1E4259|nr:endospore germination permease [Peribacillus frigoritolerans]MED3835968.1 endospore germination permease [Peribacillus frigoritolerans]MED3845651.1 endospore germination permease [Peribacillus frigoritolerans]WVN11876.1 endospore germination permease [Peribacillus frigoritolerans]